LELETNKHNYHESEKDNSDKITKNEIKREQNKSNLYKKIIDLVDI